MNSLIDYREKKELSRIELAKLLGKSVSTIYFVETGQRGAGKSLAEQWASALGSPKSKIYDLFFFPKVYKKETSEEVTAS